MAVKLLFFAHCADWMKESKFEVGCSAPKPLIDLLGENSRFQPILEHRVLLKVAVNRKLAGFETEVKDGDEVAFLPPFSGG